MNIDKNKELLKALTNNMCLIPGTTMHYIDKVGNVYHLKTPKGSRPSINKLTPIKSPLGYKVNICAKGSKKCIYVDKLMGRTYIENPNGYADVYHIDGDVYNNKVENLVWDTNSNRPDDKGLYKHTLYAIIRGRRVEHVADYATDILAVAKNIATKCDYSQLTARRDLVSGKALSMMSGHLNYTICQITIRTPYNYIKHSPNAAPVQQCKRCAQDRLLTSFYKQPRMSLNTVCKKCLSLLEDY